MSTMIDIGAAMAKWVNEIEYHREIVKKLEDKILLAKELMSFPADSKGIVEQKPSKGQRSTNTSLRSRVMTTLAERQKWLTATEISKIIQAEGLNTASKNVNTLIATTANKIVDMGRIVRRKRNGRVQYAISNLPNSKNRSTNMFEDQT